MRSKRFIQIRTIHPDGDAYEGIVLHFGRSLVVMHEVRDLFFDGILVFPKRAIKRARNGKFEKCANDIIRHSGQISALSGAKWIKSLGSIQDAVNALRSRGVWPAIETVRDGESALYLGPITSVGSHDFDMLCYGSDGEWEGEYRLPFGEVFKMEFNSMYTNAFNSYMKEMRPPQYEIR